MDNDPTSRSQNSRKRTRVDDTSSSFHLPSSDTMSALSNASRLRDPNTHGLLHNSTISAAEAAAVAAAAVGTSTPTSTTPILQPLHPPIPNFSAISQAPQLRPQNSLSHTLPSEQNHPATGIYSIALPLPNPGRAHRFCQACDHVNHVRRKLCTNCGAPKPSAVRNAVGVRNVSDPEAIGQDRRPRPDEMSGMSSIASVGQSAAIGGMAHPLPMSGAASDMYGHNPRGPIGHDPSTLTSMHGQHSPSFTSGFKSSFRLGGSGGDHHHQSLTMGRPSEDIPLPSSIGQRARYSNSNGLGAHSHRFGHTVLADPLVNPPQMPAQSMPSNSFLFAHKFPFSPDRGGSNEQYQLPSVHHNFAGSTGLQIHPAMSMEGNSQARPPFRATETQDMGHGYINAGYNEGPENGNGIGSNQYNQHIMIHNNLSSEGQGLDDGNMSRYTGPGGMRYNEQFGRHETFSGQAGIEGHQTFPGSTGSSGRPSFFNAPSRMRATSAVEVEHTSGFSSGLLLQHERSSGVSGGHDNMLVSGGGGGNGMVTTSVGVGMERYGRDVSGRNNGGNEREMVDSGRRMGGGRQNDGEKTGMLMGTGGNLEGSTNADERGRQSDEGRFAIGSIVMREKNGVGEE